MNYILDGHIPIYEPDIFNWAAWFETANRVVERTSFHDCEISTAFLGLDHQWGDGPPLLFETMIFGGELDGECWHYSTWEEAEVGHKAAVKLIEDGSYGKAND